MHTTAPQAQHVHLFCVIVPLPEMKVPMGQSE